MSMQEEKTPIPLVFAHRGASALAPENTLAAFRLAHHLGADGIELDVMLSADKELVVIHDDSVDRTTNGTGKVAQMPYAALKELDAGEKFSAGFKGEPLPTLSQVFEELGGELLINVELKNYAHPFDNLTQRVVGLVTAFHLEESVLLSSFNPLNRGRARRLNPSIPFGLLTAPGNALMNGALGRFFGYEALHPYYKDVTARLVNRVHATGKKVNTWTVDDPDMLRRMRACRVDGVICNDPAAARAVLEGV